MVRNWTLPDVSEGGNAPDSAVAARLRRHAADTASCNRIVTRRPMLLRSQAAAEPAAPDAVAEAEAIGRPRPSLRCQTAVASEGPSRSSLRDEIRSAARKPTDFGDPPASAFDPEPPFRPRRNPLKVWTWAAGIFAVVAAGLIFAVSYWGLPDWVPVERPTFAVGEPDLQLDFPREQQERRTLPNGTEFFGASGTITNIGTTTAHDPDDPDRAARFARPDRLQLGSPAAAAHASLREKTCRSAKRSPTFRASARAVQIGWKPE